MAMVIDWLTQEADAESTFQVEEDAYYDCHDVDWGPERPELCGEWADAKDSKLI